MLSVGIIVSHRSIKRERFSGTTRSRLDSAVCKVNNVLKRSKLANVEVAFDYEGFRILHKQNNSQDSIIERMMELRKEHDILIFCPLIEGEFGSGMKTEYEAIKKANIELSPDNAIFIESFIKIKDGFSESDYPELMVKSKTDLQVCTWYKDDDDFENEVYKVIIGIILNHPSVNIDPTSVPDSEKGDSKEGGDKKEKESESENSNDKQPEEGANNRKHGRGWYFGIITLILITMLSVFIWKRCSTSNPENPPVPPITQIDSARKKINERISVAEALVKQGLYKPAKDTLEAIRKDCQPEWDDVLLKINTLESLIPAQPIPYGTSGAIGGQHETESKPVYLHDGFVLTGLSGDFENYVLTQIETTSELRRAPGKKVQWGISITERKNQRGLDDGDYFVDLSVSVSIINNKTGLSLPQLPLYKNECIGSPISYEDAFNAAASEEFAKLIAIGIVNAIKNEN